jgi:hypothetical protein
LPAVGGQEIALEDNARIDSELGIVNDVNGSE